MSSDLHLPEWRVTRYVPGVPASEMNGYYVRAASEQEAERRTRQLQASSADGGSRVHLFELSDRLRVQYWKPGLVLSTVTPSSRSLESDE